MNRRGTDHNSGGSNKRRGKTGRRILTGILAFAMILTGQSEFAGVLAVRAEQKEESLVITGFVPLSEETADRTVALGTTFVELALPDTLKAYVLSEDAEKEGGVENPENPDPEDDKDETGGSENPGDGTGEEENPGDETGEEENPGDGTGDKGNPGSGDVTGEENTDGGDGTGDKEHSGSGEAGGGENPGSDETGGGENAGGGEAETAGGENPGAAEENAKSTEQEQGAGADTASAGGTLPRETFWDRMTHAVTSWLAGILSPVKVEAAEADIMEPVSIEVVWESAPTYDGDTEGSYVFTPILPEAYEAFAGHRVSD